jgi:hypothetical protein
MAILNRRNAFVGYVVIKALKNLARQKVSGAAPSARTAGAAAGALAALGGAVVFWKKTRPGDDDGA